MTSNKHLHKEPAYLTWAARLCQHVSTAAQMVDLLGVCGFTLTSQLLEGGGEIEWNIRKQGCLQSAF